MVIASKGLVYKPAETPKPDTADSMTYNQSGNSPFGLERVFNNLHISTQTAETPIVEIGACFRAPSWQV